MANNSMRKIAGVIWFVALLIDMLIFFKSALFWPVSAALSLLLSLVNTIWLPIKRASLRAQIANDLFDAFSYQFVPVLYAFLPQKIDNQKYLPLVISIALTNFLLVIISDLTLFYKRQRR